MNRLKQRLASGEVVFGFWSMIPSPMVANIMASSGADFIILDLEHGNAGLESVENLNYAIRSGGAAPCGRLPYSTNSEILRVLEVGVDSILMSHVSSVEDAKRLVGACLYPPLGVRGLSPFTTVHGYDGSDLGRSIPQANENMLVGALLEGLGALNASRKIAEVEGLDIVYIGLFDLASSLGHPGDLNHPEVRTLLFRAVEATLAAGKVPGTVARDAESTVDLLQLGFRFIAYRNDSTLLMQACRGALATFREIADGQK
jgi:4-hydroxy-2-oxoheptanedioate aldolase